MKGFISPEIIKARTAGCVAYYTQVCKCLLSGRKSKSIRQHALCRIILLTSTLHIAWEPATDTQLTVVLLNLKCGIDPEQYTLGAFSWETQEITGK